MTTVELVRAPSQSSVCDPPVYQTDTRSWGDLRALLAYIECMRLAGEMAAEDASLLGESALSLFVAGQMTTRFERMGQALDGAIMRVGSRTENLIAALAGK